MSKNEYNQLIIAGVHRSATTALFNYLAHHKQVCPAVKKELHFFTPLRYKGQIQPIENYLAFYPNCEQNQKYRLEASPSYLYGGNYLQQIILNELGAETKFIIVLRNPVSRFISAYNHAIFNKRIDAQMSLDAFYKASKNALDKPIVDNEISRALYEGLYSNHVNEWLTLNEKSTYILFFEQLTQNPSRELEKLSAWLDLDQNGFELDFYQTNSSKSFKNSGFHSISLGIYKNLKNILVKNPKFKQRLEKIYKAVNGQKKEAKNLYFSQTDELKEFYEDDIKKLSNLLKSYHYKSLPEWLK